MRILLRLFSYLFFFFIGAFVVFIAGDLIISLKLPELKPWHTTRLKHEFTAKTGADVNWENYLAQEQKLFDELDELKRNIFKSSVKLSASRYAEGGNFLERRISTNWNRSYKLDASNPQGVALLVHGISDSPYTLKAIAQALHKKGIIVYGLRLPGHGTLPSELDDVEWADWLASVRIVDKHIQQQHSKLPYYFVGYSSGAALGVKITLDAIAQNKRTPDQLFLLSPALGVSPLARFANLQRVISHFDQFKKARWLDVRPEYDPYKYNSFTKNAGKQVSLLIREVYADIDALQQQGKAEQLPRITSFQSLVDATVSTTDLVDKLYSVINNPLSELVLFDVNRMSYYKELIFYDIQKVIDALEKQAGNNFRLVMVSNTSNTTTEVAETSWTLSTKEVSGELLNLSWPEGIYSLSHVSLPFPANDPVYGYASKDSDGNDIVTLGNLSIRGEQGVLTVPAASLLRLRSNPFYSYIEKRITDAIDQAKTSETPVH